MTGLPVRENAILLFQTITTTKKFRYMSSCAWQMRFIWITAIAVCSMMSLAALAAPGFTAADADAIFDAHTQAFYRVTNGVAWHAKNTDGGKADFWTRA